jgi:hypothetical protein
MSTAADEIKPTGNALATTTAKSELPRQMVTEEATEIAKFYNVPQTLANLFFMVINNTLYPKEAFLLHMGYKRGIQAIEITKPEKVTESTGEEWHCHAKIYPSIDKQIYLATCQLPADERKIQLEYLRRPTQEWGRASVRTVRMSTMQAFLPEMAVKRAVCRALRLFASVGMTSYEELPEAELSKGEIEEAREHVKRSGKKEEPPKDQLTLIKS